MKRGAWLAVLAIGVGIFFVAGQVVAQDKPKDAKQPAAAKPADKPEAGAPEGMDPAMAEMMKLAEPGPEHAAIKSLAGTWTCDVKFWMAPGAPPEASSGTLTRKWILGDRYLSEDYEGTSMGMPFKGHGLLGYNRGAKKYESTWIDTMGTGIYYQTGKGDGKTLTMEGENYCPIEKGMKWGKSVLEFSGDKNTLKMFSKGPDGKEFQNFEMTCTRSK
jgi:hypothetical protein